MELQVLLHGYGSISEMVEYYTDFQFFQKCSAVRQSDQYQNVKRNEKITYIKPYLVACRTRNKSNPTDGQILSCTLSEYV